jgi:hypothetical protein
VSDITPEAYRKRQRAAWDILQCERTRVLFDFHLPQR